MDLTSWADEIGESGPVTIRGRGTRPVRRDPAVGEGRIVSAPSGVTDYHPDEMTIACGAGTPLTEIREATRARGQTVILPGDGTVAGALATGRSGLDRLGVGPVRDALLQASFVDHAGRVVKVGGPTVKNVSGFDLARLLVGSFGRLGFFGHVVLRTRPIPAHTAWFDAPGDAARVRDLQTRLYRPSSILWDGSVVTVLLEGHRDDITRIARLANLSECDGPPEIPSGHRWSVPPSRIVSVVESARQRVVAEMGVGIVHHVEPQAARRATPNEIETRLLDAFDPTRRLNPAVVFPQ